MKWAAIFAIILALVTPVLAVNPDEMLKDPVLEARARGISSGLRCLVCQNQSIDDSDASLARDLRLLVRERLVAGDSDSQVVDYIVGRYGEFVLLKPFFGWHTLVLWFAAPGVLLLAIGGLVLGLRRRSKQQALKTPSGTSMTPEEQEALATLTRRGPLASKD